MTKITMTALVLLATPSYAFAQSETSFTYGGIYKSLKTAQHTEFSQLSLNFFLLQSRNGEICPTTRVYLSDGNTSYDLSVTKQGKLLLPLDKKLKQDHAAITLVTDEPVTCHLAMEVAVANFELENVTPSKTKQWLGQFDAMYSTLAGWPGKYFMPKITGLTFKLADVAPGGATYKHDNRIIELASAGEHQFILSSEQIARFETQDSFELGATVYKVTPNLAK